MGGMPCQNRRLEPWPDRFRLVRLANMKAGRAAKRPGGSASIRSTSSSDSIPAPCRRRRARPMSRRAERRPAGHLDRLHLPRAQRLQPVGARLSYRSREERGRSRRRVPDRHAISASYPASTCSSKSCCRRASNGTWSSRRRASSASTPRPAISNWRSNCCPSSSPSSSRWTRWSASSTRSGSTTSRPAPTSRISG